MSGDIPALSGPRRRPAVQATALVVLLHGVGADGQDLIALADAWRARLPHAAFFAPDAPFPCDMAPFGRQWFSLLDRRLEAMTDGVRQVAPMVWSAVEAEAEAVGVSLARTALVGFSQGTMTALYTAPRQSPGVAAMLGYSGALLGADTLPAEARSRPPVCLIHGDSDDVVPPAALPAAVAGLEAVGFHVESSMQPGVGHGIDPAGLDYGGTFLSRHLGA